MKKIPKNLSDKDMLKNFHEEKTLEDIFLEGSEKKVSTPSSRLDGVKKLTLTQEELLKLEELLLALKLALYNEGTIDYYLQMELKNKKIIISPVTREKKFSKRS